MWAHSRGGGLPKKQTKGRRLHEFSMCVEGEGVKKSEIFADVIYGSPLTRTDADCQKWMHFNRDRTIRLGIHRPAWMGLIGMGRCSNWSPSNASGWDFGIRQSWRRSGRGG